MTYSLEPIWHKHIKKSQDSAWVNASGSMTEHLQQVSQQCFQVKLLEQTWQNPRRSEALALSLSAYSRAMVREVHLLCDGEICMFARSIFPADTLFGKGWQLQYLGDKPLGSVLFRDSDLHRSAFEFAQLHPGQQDYHKATEHLMVKPDLLWARRSVFYWQQKELMVEEVFLPSLLTFSI